MLSGAQLLAQSMVLPGKRQAIYDIALSQERDSPLQGLLSKIMKRGLKKFKNDKPELGSALQGGM